MQSAMGVGDENPQDNVIIAVMRRYLYSVDARDSSLLTSCFSEQATAVFNDTTDARFELRGNHAIATRLLQVVSNFASSCHGIANCAVRRLGALEADLDTFVTAHILAGDRVSSRGLRYRDRLVKEGGAWRISSRVHTPLWQFDHPAVASAIPGLAELSQAMPSPDPSR